MRKCNVQSARSKVKKNARRSLRRWVWALGLLPLVLLAGCSAYELQGTVIEGAAPMIVVVKADDPRLKQPGVDAVAIDVVLRPHEVKPKAFGPTLTDKQGHFSLAIPEMGAGFLEIQSLISARKSGFQSAWNYLQLPGADQRLLIIIAHGQDTNPPPTDILRDTIDMGRRLQSTW